MDKPASGTLRSSNEGMCKWLLGEAGYDPAGYPDLIEEMALAADFEAVDAAKDVMRSHGLRTNPPDCGEEDDA